MTSRIALTVILLALCGCMEQSNPAPKKTSIIGKTTQDIGVFDPNAKQEVSDHKIRATDPVTAPLSAYGPMIERISIVQIDQAVGLFYATEGRYPKDYDEFMEKIIKENNIKLPVLPYKGKYQYNEKTHSLEAVYPPKEEQGGEKKAE